jgi:hypothetical protein
MNNDKLVNDMLANIGDPKLQRMYGDIISGNIVKRIHCLSDTCTGRVIATIDKLGVVNETKPFINKKGIIKSGLEGSRRRFDGQMGFRCFCSNESILSKEERGIINSVQPDKDDLEAIAVRLSGRTGNEYPIFGLVQRVDGFEIEDLE